MGKPPFHCDSLEAAIASRDPGRAWIEFLAIARSLPASVARSAGVRLLAARVMKESEDRLGVARQGIAELRLIVDPGAEALADVLLLAGSQQEALEGLAQSYRSDPAGTALGHRLGLGELARALRTPLSDTPLSSARWSRVFAYLGTALVDRHYWNQWCEGRSRAYAEPLAGEIAGEAAELVTRTLRQFVLDQAEKAEQKNELGTAAQLRELAAEWEVDRAACVAAGDALKSLAHPPAPTDTPFPFGPIWFRVMAAPPQSLTALRSLISAAEWSRYERTGQPDPTAPNHGTRLRQWYSRLAPVRMAISNGQLPAARLALDQVCKKGEGCKPNPQPLLPPALGSPRVCDPACGSFIECNPGYAGLADPGREMESDAHRLAVRIALAMAAAHARADPPRLIEAAQEWVRGRVLAGILGDDDRYAEAVFTQVLGLLAEYRGKPELEAELLKQALGAVPGDELQGRLADRLTERGIERIESSRWEDGVADLRWAARLNRASIRARQNLGFALKNLAILHFNGGRYAAAQEIVGELITLAQEKGSPVAEHAEWAEERARNWPKSDDEDPIDSLLNRFRG